LRFQLSEKSNLDKYYTGKILAKEVAEFVQNKYGDCNYIEPAAGAGAISSLFKSIEAFDILPEAEGIIQQDFFDYSDIENKVVVSNPPFGKNASLAVKFFNHAARYNAKAICFIVPKTFKKDSIKNKLDLNYSLVYEKDCPPWSFELIGMEYNVPCVFQVWEKGALRSVISHKTDYFDIVSCADDADLFVRRVGGKSGMLISRGSATATTTYFIKSNTVDLKHAIISSYHELKKVADNTAGVRSISKSELHKIIGEFYVKRNIHSKLPQVHA
jgi:hypothetical protein